MTAPDQSTAEERAVARAVDLASRLPDSVMAWINRAAAEQRAEALEALADVDPTNTARILCLQRDVKAIDIAMSWLAGIIDEGRAAFERIEQEHYED